MKFDIGFKHFGQLQWMGVSFILAPFLSMLLILQMHSWDMLHLFPRWMLLMGLIGHCGLIAVALFGIQWPGKNGFGDENEA